MIPVDEAVARVLALAEPLEVETVPLVEAARRWLAEPLIARRAQPAHALSSMDGYAIRRADLPGPWRVIGEASPGLLFMGVVEGHQATRIFTGAPLPSGSDSVVMQEDVVREDDVARLRDGLASTGTWVRAAGSDFTRGDVLLEIGTQLTASRIGLAAMAGFGALPVRRRVRVALIATGNELVRAGVDPGQDCLPESNGPMLQAMLAALPCDVQDRRIVRDDLGALTDAFRAAAAFDVLVTTGGASVGDHDLVRPALLAAGASIDFWRIAMRPGKPLMAGTLGSTVVLGLPGNPVSAFVTATLFLRPLIAHLSGALAPLPRRIAVESASDLPAVGARTDFIRARWQDSRMALLPSTDSGALVPLAAADALIVRAAHAPAAPAGACVEAILLT